MTDDLQPCPFCGGRLTQDSRMMMASCGTADCYMRGLAVDLDDAESVERWNRRTPDLIPRADAELAVAEAIRRVLALLVETGIAGDAEGDPLSEMIRDLASSDALAEVQRLREERDALVAARDMMGGLWAKAVAERDAAEAERDAALARVERLRHQITEASDPDFIWGAMDNVRDAETSLDNYAAAASRAIRAALDEDAK